jgi:formylglycine-generating enzyme required for sulfatase activity
VRKTLLLPLCLLVTAFCFAQPAAEFKEYEQPIPGSTYKTKMVPIQGGSFTMGSSDKEKNRKADEGPQHKVNISPFWMAANEVTRDEFDAFFKDETTSANSEVDAITRPSPQYIDLSWGMGKEGGYPANSMQQLTALMYCRWLYNKTGIFYRLPTEAEWEYACRAGTNTAYYFGDDPKDLPAYAWNKNNSEEKFQKVGQKKPNPWGLYDMLGNVMEWTLDQYDEKTLSKMNDNVTDPKVPFTPAQYPKVLKGGGYTNDDAALRSAAKVASDLEWNKRDPQIPQSKWWLTDAPFSGFRILRPLTPPTTEEAEKFFKLYLSQDQN